MSKRVSHPQWNGYMDTLSAFYRKTTTNTEIQAHKVRSSIASNMWKWEIKFFIMLIRLWPVYGIQRMAIKPSWCAVRSIFSGRNNLLATTASSRKEETNKKHNTKQVNSIWSSLSFSFFFNKAPNAPSACVIWHLNLAFFCVFFSLGSHFKCFNNSKRIFKHDWFV